MEVSLGALLQLCWVTKMFHFFFMTKEIILQGWCGCRWVLVMFKVKLHLKVMCCSKPVKQENLFNRFIGERSPGIWMWLKTGIVSSTHLPETSFFLSKKKSPLSRWHLKWFIKNKYKEKCHLQGELWLSARMWFWSPEKVRIGKHLFNLADSYVQKI